MIEREKSAAKLEIDMTKREKIITEESEKRDID